jgi:hypothetical protein
MERGHDIDPEEIAVECIIIGSIHRLDLKTIGKEKTTYLIVTIGHLMRSIPPKPTGIEHIGSGQDQSSSLVEEIMNLCNKLNPFFKIQMFDDLKKKNNVKRLLNVLQAVKVVKLLSVNIHALIDEFWETAFQPLLEISV